jgi:hypothetical protein
MLLELTSSFATNCPFAAFHTRAVPSTEGWGPSQSLALRREHHVPDGARMTFELPHQLREYVGDRGSRFRRVMSHKCLNSNLKCPKAGLERRCGLARA